MITAHLPSGYVFGRALPAMPLVLPAAILGGVFPDFDMFWFYFIDNRAFHHHRYWVHIPGFWLMVSAIVIPLVAMLRRPWLPPILAFLGAVFVHIILDSIAGDVLWLWPFNHDFQSLITIPAVYDNRVLNFVLHPVFALELIIWVCAIALWVRRT